MTILSILGLASDSLSLAMNLIGTELLFTMALWTREDVGELKGQIKKVEKATNRLEEAVDKVTPSSLCTKQGTPGIGTRHNISRLRQF